MKKYLLPLLLAWSAIAVEAQDRPRYFDNFDTATGVRVVYTQPDRPRLASPRKPPRHYLPSPATGPVYEREAAARPDSVEGRYLKPASYTSDDRYGWYRDDPPRDAAQRSAMGGGTHLRGHSTGDAMIDRFIVESSRRYRIDPLLIYAQMGQESSYRSRALSHKGATGLMQLMPMTARRMGVTDIYDPQQNIEGGVKYMRLLLDMFNGDLALALAGYNAGEGAVIKYGYQIPPYAETQDYVRRISARYKAISRPLTAAR